MKKNIPPAAIVAVAVLAVALFGFIFMKSSSGPAPQAQNIPDYAKMSPEDIAKSRADSDAAAAKAMAERGR